MFHRLLQLAGQSALYGFGSIAAKLVAIVMLPIYVRHLSESDYGAVETVLVLDMMFSAVFRLGLQNALMRFSHDDEHDRATVVRVVLTAVIIACTTGALIMVAAAEQFAHAFLGGADQAYLVYIAAFGMWITAIFQTLAATYRVEQRGRAYLVVMLWNVAATVAFTVLFVVVIDWNAAGLLLGNYLGTAALVIPVAIHQRALVGLRFQWPLLKEMLRFSVPTIPMGVANQSLRMIDRLVLNRIAGLATLGIYGVASRTAQVVMLVVVSLQLSWQPFAYSLNDEEAKRTYPFVMTYFFFAVGWLVVAASLLADPVVRLLTVPKFYDAALAVPLLALAGGVYGIYFIAGIGAGRVKKTGYHIFVALGGVLVSLVANIALVRALEPHGLAIIGAALASVLANATLGTLMLLRSQHVYPVAYQWLRLVKAGCVICVLVAVTYAIPPGEIAMLPVRIGLVAAYPLLLVAIGFFPRAERRAIRRRIGMLRA